MNKKSQKRIRKALVQSALPSSEEVKRDLELWERAVYANDYNITYEGNEMKNTAIDKWVGLDEIIKHLEDLLKTTVVTVDFTKVSDGTIRTMFCTKNFELIPAADYPKQEALPKVVNDEIIKVYDMEAKAWRSFRKDSILNFTV